MKKRTLFAFIILMFFQYSAFAGNRIHNFQRLARHLMEGKTVRIVIQYKNCKVMQKDSTLKPGPDITGGMEIEAFEYFARGSYGNEKAYMITSVSHLIANPFGKGFVYNYVKIKAFEDNRVEITAAFLDSQTHKTLQKETYFTKIADKKRQGGAFFYSN